MIKDSPPSPVHLPFVSLRTEGKQGWLVPLGCRVQQLDKPMLQHILQVHVVMWLYALQVHVVMLQYTLQVHVVLWLYLLLVHGVMLQCTLQVHGVMLQYTLQVHGVTTWVISPSLCREWWWTSSASVGKRDSAVTKYWKERSKECLVWSCPFLLLTWLSSWPCWIR